MLRAIAVGDDIAHQRLRTGAGNGAGAEQQLDLALHRGVERGGVHHLVQQADAQRLGGIEDLGAGEIAPRMACADRGNDIGGDHRRQQTELRFGQAELRLGRPDGDVAAGDQAHAAAERRALHGGDGRLRQLVQAAHQAGEGERILPVLLLARGSHAAHPVEVGAGGERGAFGLQHQHPDRGIGGDGIERSGHLADEIRIEGVMHRGTGHAQAGDGAVAVQ